MKPLSQTPVPAQPRLMSLARPDNLPSWPDLPPSRQQEVITLLASLVLRYWNSQRPAPAEVWHDPQS